MQHAHTSWTCYMLMLHGHAGYPCYMSMPHDMLHVHAECKCCTWMSISPCCTSLLSSHVHAACPCCICCMSMLHVCPMLYAHATYWMKTLKWTKDMQYAHTARTCCMDMHHGHAGYRWRMDIALCPWLSAACPSCKPMLHVHASWHAAWTFYMKMLHEHVACTCCNEHKRENKNESAHEQGHRYWHGHGHILLSFASLFRFVRFTSFSFCFLNLLFRFEVKQAKQTPLFCF